MLTTSDLTDTRLSVNLPIGIVSYLNNGQPPIEYLWYWSPTAFCYMIFIFRFAIGHCVSITCSRAPRLLRWSKHWRRALRISWTEIYRNNCKVYFACIGGFSLLAANEPDRPWPQDNYHNKSWPRENERICFANFINNCLILKNQYIMF